MSEQNKKEEIIKSILDSANGSWSDMITEGFEAGEKFAAKPPYNTGKELERRLSLIKSEPEGLVRETMIDNLLIDLPKEGDEFTLKNPIEDTPLRYKSHYPSEITYKSDKNFVVRLKAFVDRSMTQLGYNTSNEQFKQLVQKFNTAEDCLFESVNKVRPEPIDFVEWIALKSGLWFDNEYLLWNIPDYNVDEWRSEHGQGFPTDQFRFTTKELYDIKKHIDDLARNT